LGNDALPDEIIIAPKFHYTISAQPVVNSGISGTLSVHKPFLHPDQFSHFGHSIGQIGVGKLGPAPDGSGLTDTVEIGWHVDFAVEGDYEVHLFVDRKVNGSYLLDGDSCYNKCEFVRISHKITAGSKLKNGASHLFSIKHKPAFR
jgi:hypothetical protein